MLDRNICVGIEGMPQIRNNKKSSETNARSSPCQSQVALCTETHRRQENMGGLLYEDSAKNRSNLSFKDALIDCVEN